MANAAVDQVGFADPKVEISNFDRYKGVKGRTDRVAVISSTVMRGWRYYHEGSQTAFRAPTDKALLEKVKSVMGEPDQQFIIILFHYATDESGELLNDDKIQGKVKIWRVSETRYAALSDIHKRFPLLDKGFGEAQYDLIIKTTEERYQRMELSPAESAHWKKNQKWYDALKERLPKALDKGKMAIGKELSESEILNLLGMSSAAAPGATDNAGDIDLSDIADV